MSKGQTKKTREAAGNRRKLTRAEKKQIAAVIRQAKGDGKAHTAQQTIPYLAMYPDGICKVAQRKYSKSIAFEDINYQLAQADDKTAIFENWCDFLNYFDDEQHRYFYSVHHTGAISDRGCPLLRAERFK